MDLAWRPTPASLTARLHRARRDEPTGGRTAVLDAGGAPPPGHARIEAVADLGRGRAAFDRVAGALLRWALHREAGMVLACDHDEARPGGTIVNAGRFGPVAVVAPCRVVAVVDEPARRGFVYAALPGHPLAGEEQFTVELDAGDGAARLRIRSFSRPAPGLPALAPPLTRTGQRLVNRRYLAAARRLAAA